MRVRCYNIMYMKSPPVIYIVIPCFNEEDCLRETTKRLKKKIKNLVSLHKVSTKSRIVYVDDGSRDQTWPIIKKFDSEIIGIKLSKNMGHQNALLAGLEYSKDFCDAAISMDADLQ